MSSENTAVIATLTVKKQAKFTCPHCGTHYVACHQYLDHVCGAHLRRGDLGAVLPEHKAKELTALYVERRLYTTRDVEYYAEVIGDIDDRLERLVKVAEIAERQLAEAEARAEADDTKRATTKRYRDKQRRINAELDAILAEHEGSVNAHQRAVRDAKKKLAEAEANRRGRIEVTAAQRLAVYKRDNFTCQYCGAAPPEVEIHIEHRTPVVRGGTNELDNLCVACADCNLRKHTMTAEEFTAQEASS